MKIKSKDIIFAETRECSAQYGVSNGDIMTCPMGVEIEIVGMGKVDLRLYAKFPGNIISPLQPSNREELQQSEYKPKELEQSKIFFNSSQSSTIAEHRCFAVLRKQQAMKSKISGRSCDLLATTCRFDDSTLSSAEMVRHNCQHWCVRA
jgi:hypothetical protein